MINGLNRLYFPHIVQTVLHKLYFSTPRWPSASETCFRQTALSICTACAIHATRVIEQRKADVTEERILVGLSTLTQNKPKETENPLKTEFHGIWCKHHRLFSLFSDEVKT